MPRHDARGKITSRGKLLARAEIRKFQLAKVAERIEVFLLAPVKDQTPYRMKRLFPGLLLATVALTSCQTAHDAAVSTFRVLDAPHQYVRRKLNIEDEENTTTTTSSTTVQQNAPPYQQPSQQPPPPRYTSRAETVSAPPPRHVTVTEQTRTQPPSSTPTPPARSTTVATSKTQSEEPRTTSTSHTTATEKSNLPYAKPVPGKPGYVFSPYDSNGGYVDVTGFAPGSKVKDPYSGKIFLVP